MSSIETITAFPLSWPAGRLRTPSEQREAAKFTHYRERLTIANGRDRVIAELRRLGAEEIVFSSNLRTRKDGVPISDQAEPKDPAVAVYFMHERQQRVIACDKWRRVADNLAAVAGSIEARRKDVRMGTVAAEQVFAGFAALPAPDDSSFPDSGAAAAWLASVGDGTAALILLHGDAFAEVKRRAYRSLHPDRNNGVESNDYKRLQAAIALLDKHHEVRP